MSLISRSAERSHSCRGSDAPCPTAAMLTTFKDHLRLHAGLDQDRIDRLSAAMEQVRLERAGRCARREKPGRRSVCLPRLFAGVLHRGGRQ